MGPVRILNADQGLSHFGPFFSLFCPKKVKSSVLQHFFSFDDTCNIKYVLNAEDLYLVPQKKSEWPKVYFFHNRCLKLSYFHDFDGRECTIYAYFRYSFVHISSNNNLTKPFLCSKWPQWYQLSNEPSMDDLRSILCTQSSNNRVSAIIRENAARRHYFGLRGPTSNNYYRKGI